MSCIVTQAQAQVRDAILAAAQAAAAAGDLPATPTGAFNLEVPAGRQNGDLSANAAMVWARELRQPPRKSAEALARHIDLTGTYAARCEAAGAGFLNFYFGDAYYADLLADVLQKGEGYGRSGYGKGQRMLVEFVSANPTGPMHMGNARGGALGDCLAAVLDAAGYEVEREFYINDSGNQIEKLAASLDVRARQLHGEEVQLPEDAYHGEDITQRAQAFLAQNPAWIEDETTRRKALVAFVVPKNVEEIEQNLARYRIAYNTWFRESTLYASGEVERVIALLRESGYTYEKEGVLWFKGEQLGCDKDFVLVRGNGFPTYIVPDIAYHYNKLVTRGFDRAINIWGADHHGYMLRLKAILPAIGIDADRLDVILMQLVKLVKDGEVVRMSKRTGKSITLEDLLDDIPIDALRFFFNMRDPASTVDFDLDLAVEQSAQNPVYYCQYAHARICSLFKKLTEEGVAVRACTSEELQALRTPEERALIRLLGQLPSEIIDAAKSYDPARVTRYCLDLAAQFHKFYNACRVKGEAEPLMQARLQLCAAVRTVLASLLRMFKITVPTQM
ncbi:MAG: arginine--tRNA ligase [Oscillospiraceae bacterium]|jgi:arginyl-tRNA synthetase|nr:arginine--tRNA ligase [Oscillospiraceae bacterium]